MKYRSGHAFVHIFVLLILLPVCSFCQKKEHVSEVDPSTLEIRQIGIYKDPSRTATIDEIHKTNFQPSETGVIDFGFTNDACWLALEVVNTTNAVQNRLLKVGKLLVDSVQLFFKQGDHWRSVMTGVNIPNSQKLIKGRSSYFPIEIEGQDTATLYLRAVSTYGIQFSISILDEQELQSRDTNESLIQGFYLGALLIITLYNLFLGFSIKDNVYFHYAMANLAAIMLALSVRGFFSYYFPDDYAGWTPHLITGVTALYIALSSNFNIRILNLRKYSRHAYYMMLLVAAISLLLAVGLSVVRLFGYTIHNLSLAHANILFTITAIYAGIMAYRNGSHYAKYYLMGWTLLLLSVLLYTLMIVGYIERNYFTANFYLIGSVLEVLLLSFALADRYNYLQTESNTLRRNLRNKEGDLAMVISDNKMRYQFRKIILEKVEEINNSETENIKSQLNSFVTDLKLQLETEEKFNYIEGNIEKINTQFESKLKAKYPDLSSSEIEICHYIRLNLSTKEIARLRGTSVGAIKVMRHRIKKKLSLTDQTIDTLIREL
ncbi:MAG: 7TM diverse intracellular signaling domain-containing protein [Reichenbachiella sp.]|uniref:7TM diverse intracellular signaling domain-containing protein n=1 Tax=Reichenbachiella sp. TaxID=2184521 RepID=UPI0032636FB3